jgi:hypothetical protein
MDALGPMTCDGAFSPAVLMSLEAALTNVYWFKSDLRSFLGHTLTNRSILPLLDWKDTKRSIVATLVGLLARDGERFGDDLVTLMNVVASVEDFSHLELLPDRDERVRFAHNSVAMLRGLLGLSRGEKEIPVQTDESKNLTSSAASITTQSLAHLRQEFLLLLSNRNSEEQGQRWNSLISALFDQFKFDCGCLKLDYNRFRGTFKHESVMVLLESRWHGKLIEFAEILALGERVWREPEDTLGLFLSLNGFTKEAIRSCWDVGRPVLLMDGQDLMAVLEERIDFSKLLLKKRLHALQTGEILLPVSSILAKA